MAGLTAERTPWQPRPDRRSPTCRADAAKRPAERERVGWYFYDWANSAFATTVVTVFLGPYLSDVAENAAGRTARTCTCSGVPIASGSVFAYTVSLSVILQVFVLPVVGAIADRSSHKKQLLALFAYIGAGATIAMVFLTGDRYLLGAGLFLLANVALGASSVVYNSFLPQIAEPDERDRVSSIGWAHRLHRRRPAAAAEPGGAARSTGRSGCPRARWRAAASCRPGVWWAVFTTLPLLRLRNRPAVAGRRDRLGAHRRVPAARAHAAADAGVPADARVPGRVPDLQRRHPDGHHAWPASTPTRNCTCDRIVQIETILLVQFLAFGGALLLGRLARRYGARNTVLVEPRRVDWSRWRSRTSCRRTSRCCSCCSAR